MMKPLLKIAGIGLIGAIGVSAFVLVGKLVMAPLNMAHTAANSASAVVSKTLDANNVIHTYEWFHDANNQLKARVNQIAAHKAFVADESDKTEKQRLRMELAAMQQSCRDLAGRYNANATKTNRSIFMGREAPSSIDITSCE